jgi:hypothetical protein
MVYNDSMAKKKRRKKQKTAATSRRTRLIPPGAEMPEEEDMEENESGMFLEKEDVKLIYNALKEYKPTEEEEHLHSVLVEEFKEMLVVDYDEIPPDMN